MALILISTFERKEGRTYLPGATGYPFVAKETSTYADIIKGVVRLEDHCVDRQSSPGWIQLGASNGLGAFFWATGSSLDQDFPGWISDPDGTDAGSTFDSKPQLTG
ncbi:MAG: hypothetical protein OHK93_003822 [Ramalina farinacea]|uniref:Uncharacterized protein n=1 Tax=Ramalina farinacea TaxID=258253 RepID=A0AA43QJ35_9LECA|nr:hypothetical protein [Ramalina farinacea]